MLIFSVASFAVVGYDAVGHTFSMFATVRVPINIE